MMKISDIQKIGSINPYNRHLHQQQAMATGKKEKQKDEVQISAQAKELQNAQPVGSNSEAEEVRSQKIEELKKAVSTGTYHVESGKIAEKLFPYIK